jgi:hypothetical protein
VLVGDGRVLFRDLLVAVVSSEARIEVPMPFIVADSIASFLGCSILHRPCILRRSVQAEHQ